MLSRRDEVAQIVPSGAGARMFLRPFIITAGLLAAWWWFFRHEAEGSRVIALLAALFFGATAIVMVLSMQVSDWHYPAVYTVGYPLCALAFLSGVGSDDLHRLDDTVRAYVGAPHGQENT